MKVSFRTEGGFAFFPGLNKPLELDTDQLPPDEAAHLKQLVAETDFFHMPPPQSATIKGADMQKHTITITDAGRQHSVTVTDTDFNPPLQNLVSYLKKKQKESRSS